MRVRKDVKRLVTITERILVISMMVRLYKLRFLNRSIATFLLLVSIGYSLSYEISQKSDVEMQFRQSKDDPIGRNQDPHIATDPRLGVVRGRLSRSIQSEPRLFGRQSHFSRASQSDPRNININILNNLPFGDFLRSFRGESSKGSHDFESRSGRPWPAFRQ